MKRIVFAGFLFLLCLISLSAFAESDLTLMVYMTGSDLESQAGAASADLEELCAACPKDGLQITILTGGTNEWKNGIPGDRNILWQITSEGLLQLESHEASSMGNAGVLREFLDRSVSFCPAKKYALILWDHGAGPMMGVCFDERFHSDGLTLEELAQALGDSSFAEEPLMFIGFDACLMSSVEVANAVAPYAEYMVASQEPEPSAGWDYRFVSEIARANSGEEAIRLIIDAYADSQRDTLSPVTLSCVRLGAMKQLEESLDRFFGGLSSLVTRETYPQLAACRFNTKTLGASTPMEWDLVDLGDLVDMLAEDGLGNASEVREALNNAVPFHYKNEKYVSGLSIYAPFGNKDRYTSSWAAQYAEAEVSRGYRDYTKAFADQWMENQRSFWRDAEALEAAEDKNREFLSVQLTEEEARDIASARLIILEQITMGSKEEYRLLNSVENIRPFENTLSAVYNQEALYLVLEDGTVDGPMVWRPLDSNTSALGLGQTTGGIATFSRVETPDHQSLFMYLTWIPNEEGFYEPGTPYLLNEDLDIFSVWARGLQPGDMVEIGGYMRKFPETDRFYQDWEAGDIVTYVQDVYTDQSEWKMAFLPLQSSSKRFALFEITDLHGNAHLTKPVELPDTSTIALLSEPLTRVENGLEVTMEGASLYTGADANLRLNLSLINHGENKMTVQFEGFSLNQSMFSDSFCRFDWGENNYVTNCELSPEMGQELNIELSKYRLQLAGERQLRSVRVYLGLYRKFSERIKTLCFDFDLSANLGLVLPVETDDDTDSSPLAVLDQKGVRLSLMRIGYNPVYYDYIAECFLENNTDEDYWVKNIYFRINGSDWLGGIWSGLLPAHSHTSMLQSVSTHEEKDGKYISTFPVEDSSQIETLVISMDLVKEGDTLEETFHLTKHD